MKQNPLHHILNEELDKEKSLLSHKSRGIIRRALDTGFTLDDLFGERFKKLAHELALDSHDRATLLGDLLHIGRLQALRSTDAVAA